MLGTKNIFVRWRLWASADFPELQAFVGQRQYAPHAATHSMTCMLVVALAATACCARRRRSAAQWTLKFWSIITSGVSLRRAPASVPRSYDLTIHYKENHALVICFLRRPTDGHLLPVRACARASHPQSRILVQDSLRELALPRRLRQNSPQKVFFLRGILSSDTDRADA